EDLVAGLARDAELPTHLGHRLAIQEPSDETKALFHYRTRFPRHRHLPPESGKCHPCPMSRAAHEMPNSRHIWVIGSPSRSRATKRRRSSITELAFHGIDTSRPKAESVTHVSGTKCHPCLGPLSPDCWTGKLAGVTRGVTPGS